VAVKLTFQPTVIPLSSEPPLSLSTYTEADSFKSLPKNISGRYYSIADYHALYMSGELTPIAVAESLLPLIRRDAASRSSHSIAFTDSNAELILHAAKESTQRYKDGKSLGLLDGIPVGVKDEVNVAGYRTHSGRKADDRAFEIKTDTTWPVQKWQEAGAIVIGKTNMHELGSGELPLLWL
jgi:Asp-tRNA(Asn)/Glu-tRNA(Gln) amidotransferase A subunit family amidase